MQKLQDWRFATGPGDLRIELDAAEIVPDDPGAGTPAMVYEPSGRGSATFWCALAEGELMANDGRTWKLTPAQARWLDEMEPDVTTWLAGRTDAIAGGFKLAAIDQGTALYYRVNGWMIDVMMLGWAGHRHELSEPWMDADVERHPGPLDLHRVRVHWKGFLEAMP